MLKDLIHAIPVFYSNSMNKYTLRNILLLIGASSILACATYILNLWLFSSNLEISSTDLTFWEAVIFILAGVLFLLGSGGITRRSQGAALLAATAEAIYGEQIIGPSEIYRRDAWKPKGLTRLGLTLIIGGIILLLMYSVLSYMAL